MISCLIAGVIFLVLIAVIIPELKKLWSWFWKASQADRDSVTPLLAPLASLIGTLATLAVGVILARAALRQARIATRLAEIAAQQAATASQRHEEQTKSDFQRRITESFAKAVEQLGSEKLEVRLGGIYSLERISQQSPADYWTVMENLTAFVRERSLQNESKRNLKPVEQRVAERAYFLWEEAGKPEGRTEEFRVRAADKEKLGELPPTDIAAVLTAIRRRRVDDLERNAPEELAFRLSRCGFEAGYSHPGAS